VNKVKMHGDIRVKTHAKYKNLYKEFRNLIVRDSHELFFVSACLGYSRDIRSPLGRNADERFWSNTITPEEYSTYYAMLIETAGMEFDSINSDTNVLAIIEEYSNAGMEILISELLVDFVIEQNNDIRLDPSCKKDIPKIILAYLYDQTTQNANS